MASTWPKWPKWSPRNLKWKSYALQLTLINEISIWKNLVKYMKILPIRKDLLHQENKGRFYTTIETQSLQKSRYA